MPQYMVDVPGSGKYRVDSPEDLTNDQVWSLVQGQLGQPAPQPKEGIGAAFTGGIKRFGSDIETALESVINPQTAAERGVERSKKLGEQYAPGASLEKVKKAYEERGLFPAVGEAVSQVPAALAEQFPNMATAIGGARLGAMAGSAVAPGIGTIVGGLAGAGLSALPQLYAQNLQRQAEEKNPEVSRTAALGAALPGAALEVFSEVLPLGRGAIGKLLGPQAEALLKKGTNEAVEAAAKESIMASIAKGGIKGLAAEVPTEVAQQMLERLQAGLPLTDEEAQKEYGEAAYGAALVGGPFGVAGRTIERPGARAEYQQLQQQQADEQLKKEQEEAALRPPEPETHELPGGFKATARQVGETIEPEGYQIFAEGSDAPLSTVTTEAEVQPKIERLNTIRQQETEKSLQEIDKINEGVAKARTAVEVMEATGQTQSEQYMQAQENLRLQEQQAQEQVSQLMERTQSLSVPLTMKPMAPVTRVQNEYDLTHKEREGEVLGTFKTPEQAASHIAKQIGPEEYQKQAQELQASTELKQQLQPLLKQFGLKDVDLNVAAKLPQGEGGSYLKNLISIALDEPNPVQTLRHESVHALKDLGFFTPDQWRVLNDRANKEWINVLKETPHAEGQSRHDAYVDMFTKQGEAKGLTGNELNSYVNNNLTEEAIADAFGSYDKGAKPPPGMIAALFKRIKAFFEALRNHLNGAGFQTADDIFGKIEKGQLKATPKESAETQKLSLPIVMGEEKPDFKIKPTVDTVGKYFDDQVKERSGDRLDYNDKQSFDQAVESATKEVEYQLAQEKSGLDWYEEDIKEAFKQTEKFIPQLSEEKNRLLFSVVAGIMSPQTNARDNWFIAAKAFEHYIATKEIPGTNPETGGLWQGGTQSANKKTQLDFLNNMVKDMGQGKALEWLFSDHTVREINQFRLQYGNMKSGIDGKLADIKPGLYAFGPKVGPFVSNLNGIHDVTVDKWMTRTFNRYFGKMLGPDGKIVDAPTEPQRRAVKALVNEVAKNARIKPYQAQSLLWFYEQKLFTKMGVLSPSYGFSDGGRKYAESRGKGGKLGISGAAPSAARPVKGEKRETTRPEQPAARPSAGGEQPKYSIGERGRLEEDRRLAPLEDAPSVEGFHGPDPRLVGVAEKYAAEKGIELKRQARYVDVDEDRARRIAEEYDRMDHAPQDPQVKAAYKDLIKQTTDQYRALENAGYKFWFIDTSKPDNLTYLSSPWNAMRDIRANKEMGIYPTNEGFGNETDFSPEANPLLSKTNIKWPVGGPNGPLAPVLANDLFRAVHDAFGHGLEGAGFRARGEENAWQAHAKLFTGPALGALTSETRGQNSWLNYGPSGENNQTAKVEDTVFADQKTGLMPEWTWKEGRVENIEKPVKGIVLGTKQPDASSFNGVHYGNAKVEELNAAKYGTGLRGAERRRLEDAFDDRIKKRVYFYISKEDGTMPAVESGVGNHVYKQQFDNILAPGPAMNKLFTQAQGDSNQFETEVVDAGYDGYAVPSMGMMVILNHNAPVNYVGTQAEIAMGEKKLSLRAPETPEFKRWFGDSKIVGADGEPKVMYHGTARDITEFRGKQAGAIFLTDNPKFAEMFSKDSAAWMSAHPEEFLSKEELAKGVKNAIAAIRKDYKALPEGKVMIESLKSGKYEDATAEAQEYLRNAYKPMMPTGPNILPVYVRAENPFDYENPDHVAAVVAEMNKKFDSYGRALGNKIAGNLKTGNWEEIENSTVQKAVKDLGFDGFYVKEGGQKNLAVYEPSQIKSATGNIGTYDINNPDIRYSLKNVAFPSAEEAQEAADKAAVPDTEEFKQYIGASKWLDEGGDPIKMFHGTTSDFVEFKDGIIYLSDTAKESERFADIDEDRLREQMYRALNKSEKIPLFEQAVEKAVESGRITEERGAQIIKEVNKSIPAFGMYQYKSVKPEMDEILMDLSPSKKKVMPLYARSEMPFDFRNPDHVDQVLGAVAYLKSDTYKNAESSKYQEQWERNLKGQLQKGLTSAIEDKLVQKAIRKIGFDGFVSRKSQTSPLTYAVYQPNQVKSITGNLGEYGMETKNIRYSLPTMSAGVNAAVDRVTTTREQKGWAERLLSTLAPEKFSSYRQAAINRYNRLSEADKLRAEKMGGEALLARNSAEAAALMSDNHSGVVASVMGVGNRRGGVPVIRNGVTLVDHSKKGVSAIFAPLAKYNDPKVYQYFQFYSAVKRGARLFSEGRERLITPADIKHAAEIGQKFREFEDIRKEWVEFNNALVDYQKKAGVLSDEAARQFTMYSDYIPFYRQMDGEQTLGPKIYNAISGVKTPKALKGGEAPLADFLETITRNTHAAIGAGMKNIAAQRAVKVGKDVLIVHNIQPGSKVSALETISVLENGKQVQYQCTDQLFIDAVKSLNMPELPFMGLLSAPANFLRNVVTRDPGFIMTNLLRDSLSAYVTSGANMTPIAGTIINFGKAMKGVDPSFEALMDAGILGGYEFSANVEQSGKTFAKDLEKKSGHGKSLLTPFKSVWDGLEHATTASDAATRMAVYERVLKETGDEAEALYRAQEVMNFNRKGSSPVVRILTAAVPFLNARIQGLDVFYRASTGNMNTADAKEIQRKFWVRGMTMLGLSMMYYFAVAGNPDYEDQEQETKDNNWIIPGVGRIPIPFEVGTLFKTVPERIAAYFFGTDTGEDFRKAMYRAANSFVPLSPAAYIPQTMKPILESMTNYNFFTQREIVGAGMKDIDPEFQVGPGTSALAEFLGKLGLSPLKTDHVIKGYTGTMGMYAVDLIDTIMDLNSDSPKPAKRFEQMPVIKRFAIDPEARGSVTAYYDLKHTVDTTVRTMNLLEKTSRPEDYARYLQENVGALAVRPMVSQMDKTMTQLRDMRRQITNSPMSAEEKRDALTAIGRAEKNLTANIQTLKKTISELK
jgi:Large polyvalent protein associated domain 38/ADP-Ribosyltransferase in polyvalent proteins